jgi:hypothetical protein
MTSTPPPPAFFRSVVIISCVALLVGVAGIFYFHGRDEAEKSTHPLDAATVSVRGLESVAGIQLRAIWRDHDGIEETETGKPSSEAGLWDFHRTPEGIPLTLEVLRHGEGAKQTLHSQLAILTRGAHFDVWLPGAR